MLYFYPNIHYFFFINTCITFRINFKKCSKAEFLHSNWFDDKNVSEKIVQKTYEVAILIVYFFPRDINGIVSCHFVFVHLHIDKSKIFIF